MYRTGFRAFSGEPNPLPESLRGGWALFKAGGLRGGGTGILARVEIVHEGRSPEVIALHEASGGRFWAVVFVNESARSVRLQVFGALRTPDGVAWSTPRRIGSFEAAWRVLTRTGALPRLSARPLPVSVVAWKDRIRAAEAASISDLAVPHAQWIETFAAWSEDTDRATRGDPEIAFLVFSPGPEIMLTATLASIGGTRHAVVGPQTDWRGIAAGLLGSPGSYLALLGAGELLVPHAVDIARRLLVAKGLPGLALADEDRISPAGVRIEPAFKPEPNHALMLSGTLAHGLWLVRGDEVGLLPDIDAGGHAELARMALWFARWREGQAPGERLPVILTSRRQDAPSVPAKAAAAIVDRHLALGGFPMRAVPSWPVRLRPQPAVAAGPVAAIVPSTLKAPHGISCLLAILRGTDALNFEMIVAVAQPDPLDEDQRAAATHLAESGARVIHLPEQSFNFARTCNLAARETQAPRLLLLNDDVSPLSPDWLARMCAFLADRRVGVVGARLCYPDGRLQHAGVIMGLAGFCEHAFRFLPANAPGYEWRAQLPQRLSAVTGACLLIDADLWRELGGMDEGYPSAYNDVDLCLRADEAGREVVLSDATLVHHELQTYQSHFGGERAAFENAETARMRLRWAARIAADPYYSPNLDLSPGLEWTAAVPPRLSSFA